MVCDGPVDAVWIENMNTVLDDNKMLCLANSERIKFTPYVHMVFEVGDLAQASPATVSRCGNILLKKYASYINIYSFVLIVEEKMCLIKLYMRPLPTIFVYKKKKQAWSTSTPPSSAGCRT